MRDSVRLLRFWSLKYGDRRVGLILDARFVGIGD